MLEGRATRDPLPPPLPYTDHKMSPAPVGHPEDTQMVYYEITIMVFVFMF